LGRKEAMRKGAMPGEDRGFSQPVDSASVIVLREDGEPRKTEVLLLRRNLASSAFAGGFVFPGGHVDAGDAEPSVIEALTGIEPQEARRVAAPSGDWREAIPFFTTAIRELFEEAGVLLAKNAAGAHLDLRDPQTKERFSRWREKLAAGEKSFKNFVQAEGLRLCGDALVYFSRWITPVSAPARFDTRFFAALLPRGQEALADNDEATEARWLAPRKALAEASAGRIMLFPPTARILEELSDLGDASSILAAGRSRPIEPILPKVASAGGIPVILLPGDVAYEAARPGEEVAEGGAPLNRMGVCGSGWRTIA